MTNIIRPASLKYYRRLRKLSQAELSHRTRPKEPVSLSTIKRLEGSKEDCSVANHVLRGLSAALTIDADRLSEDPRSLTERDEPRKNSLTTSLKLNVTVEARNALNLVSRRYQIKESDIVDLAPFLMLWAAESSLRERQKRIDLLEEQWDSIQSLSGFEHLSGHLTQNDRGQQVMDDERQSIEDLDIFGLKVDEDSLSPGYELSEQNPMARFLSRLCDDLGDLATFEFWSPEWNGPGYVLGREEAAQIVGNDDDAVAHIVEGRVLIDEIPADKLQNDKAACAAWVKAKGNTWIAEFENKLLSEFGLQ